MGKLLTILGVPDDIQENLPPEIFQGEQMINVMQTVYESAPQTNKKIALASAISESVRLLLVEIEKYKGVQPKKQEPESKKEEDLPFKVGDKFCMKKVKQPYLIENIDTEKGLVTISGFTNSGEAKIKDFQIKWVVLQINNGTLFTCPEKTKKPRNTKEKQDKTPKTAPPKAEAPEKSSTPIHKTPKKQQPEPPKPKIYDPETTKKIRELQNEIEEINDTLVAFEEDSEEYLELTEEMNRIKNEIENLKK